MKNPIRARGSGLRVRRRIHLALLPAPADTGIVFRRVDLPGRPRIPVCPGNVDPAESRLTLRSPAARGDASVTGVEHLLSAFAGLGVDNVCVETDAPELPVMDGSAGPFVFLVQAAGITELAAARRFIRLRRRVEVTLGQSWVRLEPYDGFKASVALGPDHPGCEGQPQAVSIDFSAASFVKEISRARSFRGTAPAAPESGAAACSAGPDDDAGSGVRHETAPGDGGLRYRDEFVKHKLLDAIGDLYLLGHPLMAAYSAYQAGHALNRRLLDTLQANPETWESVIFDGAAAVDLRQSVS